MLPVLFKIGSFPVHSWGLLLMIGFFAGTLRAAKNGMLYGFKSEDVWDVALWSLLGGIIGARLIFVLLNLHEFAANPAQIAAVWTGGMTFYGGLFGGILAGGIACRYKKMNLADFGDLAALSLPIGYAFGRIGCFLNGCCYGGACELPWAMRFHLHDDVVTPPSHPAQLYGVLAAIFTYFILLPFEKQRRFRGQILLAYIVLYSVYRFFLEFVREGVTADMSGIAHLTQGQVASLIFAVGASVMLVVLSRKAAPRPAAL